MTMWIALLVLSAAPSISGRVVDQFDRPVSATVCSNEGCVDSDQTGHFAFAHLSPGTHLLKPTGDWFEAESVEAHTGEVDLTLVVRAMPQLRGEVVDERSAVIPGLRVDDKRAGSRFRVAFEKIPSSVELSAPGFATEIVTVSPPDQFGDASIPRTVLKRGREITITLTGTSGEPIPTARPMLVATMERLIRGPPERVVHCGNAMITWFEIQAPTQRNASGVYRFLLASSQRTFIIHVDGFETAYVTPGASDAVSVTLKPRVSAAGAPETPR